MNIQKIHLKDFRNFKNKPLDFSKKTSIILGENGIGKTNILEAIYLLSTGKSFKARLEEDMIHHNLEVARVSGSIVIETKQDSSLSDASYKQPATNLEVVLTKGNIHIGDSLGSIQKAPRKRLLTNGVPKRLIDFAGNLVVTLFGPWDMDLVTQSPSLRRKFLDSVLSQVDREYRRSILSYEKGLRQRNKVLWFVRENPGVLSVRDRLMFWDKLLIKNGDYISGKREEFINYVNETADFSGQDFALEYDKSAISEGRLEKYKNEEIASATTLVGPHRDDFVFKLVNTKKVDRESRDLSSFGSRGEQRMGVLWLKLAELSYVESQIQEKPVLLLDDIFSELDHSHREIVMDVIKNQQTIITTADPHFVKSKTFNVINL